jgi:hypothetical protein
VFELSHPVGLAHKNSEGKSEHNKENEWNYKWHPSAVFPTNPDRGHGTRRSRDHPRKLREEGLKSNHQNTPFSWSIEIGSR